MKKMFFLILLSLVFQGFALYGQTDSAEIIEHTKELYPDYSKAFDKMSNEQVLEIIRNIENNKTEAELKKALFGNKIAIIAPFIFIILVVIVVQLFKYKRKRDLYILFSKYIEADKEIPRELIVNPIQPKNDLRRGLVWGFTGIAIIIASIFSQPDLLLVGLIPFFVGIAFTLSYFLIRKNNANK